MPAPLSGGSGAERRNWRLERLGDYIFDVHEFPSNLVGIGRGRLGNTCGAFTILIDHRGPHVFGVAVVWLDT